MFKLVAVLLAVLCKLALTLHGAEARHLSRFRVGFRGGGFRGGFRGGSRGGFRGFKGGFRGGFKESKLQDYVHNMAQTTKCMQQLTKSKQTTKRPARKPLAAC
jgi:hypothetical protein